MSLYKEINTSCFRYSDDIDTFIESIVEPSFYVSALANMSAFGDRLHPYRGHAPEALFEIRDLGVRPDIIYIDSAKNRLKFDVAYECFANAKLCGDDWEWGAR